MGIVDTFTMYYIPISDLVKTEKFFKIKKSFSITE